jgi:hypothetical protein
MTPEQKQVLTDSFRALVPYQNGVPAQDSHTLLDRTLRRLAPNDPALVPLGRGLMSASVIVLEHLDRLDRAVPLLWRMSRRNPHGELTATRADLLRQAFLETLAERLGADFTPEANAAWTRLFDFVSDALRRAATDQTNSR